MNQTLVLLKHNGCVHEMGAELDDSDDDSDMLSETSETGMQRLVDSESEPDFEVPEGLIDSDHEADTFPRVCHPLSSSFVRSTCRHMC